MIFYHGSTLEIPNPDINHSHHYLDFGKGFYVTEELHLARKRAKKASDRIHSTQKIINVYEWDESLLPSLQAIDLRDEEEKWVEVIRQERTSDHYFLEGVDLVIGPSAEEKTIEKLRNQEEIEEELKRLNFEKSPIQWTFKTMKALESLKFVESFSLK